MDNELARIAAALEGAVAEAAAWRKAMFGGRPSKPKNAGTSRQVSERKENDMFVIDYLENFDPLPPAVGNDADITKGIWAVVNADGTVIASTDVEYDLDTRAAITADVPWTAPKGPNVTKKLYYLDDENPPNVGKIAEVTVAVADLVGPNAPAGAGTTSGGVERFVPDA